MMMYLLPVRFFQPFLVHFVELLLLRQSCDGANVFDRFQSYLQRTVCANATAVAR